MVIAGRNPAKCAVTAIEIREETRNPFIEYLVADLSSQYQVRGLADEFKARHHQLDVLVINAGALYMSRQYSADKIEMTFALNHLSYFLLTNLLLDTLVDSPSARVVNVASSAHQEARLELADIHDPHRYFGFRAYSRSKLCNLLFTYELVRRLEETEVTVNALHPGLVATSFLKNNGSFVGFLNFLLGIRGIREEAGATTTVYAASSPDMVGVTGKYLVKKTGGEFLQVQLRRVQGRRPLGTERVLDRHTGGDPLPGPCPALTTPAERLVDRHRQPSDNSCHPCVESHSRGQSFLLESHSAWQKKLMLP